MDAEHAIFHTPFEVDLEYEELSTPEHYRKYADGRDLPDALQGWRVHGELEQKDFGLVSDGYGFEDSPDCEYISGGLNSKGPRSLALGRQGNWFLWGFCAPPSEMTEAARLVYLNTIAYMQQFDGQRPLVTRERRAREWALVYAGYLDEESMASWVRKHFAAELLEAAGDDPDVLRKHVGENLPYLWHDGTSFRVDEDAVSLGISNRDVALLARCIECLEAGEDVERARRVLERYTEEAHEDASAWRAWWEAHHERLFFSDVGGYRFFVAPER
ncbi:MAG: hypothetical protein ACYTG6_16100 [Planctomycetota bacterium]